MQLIPMEQAFTFAIALSVIGMTAVVFGIVTIIDTKAGRASAGDACMAFGLICCAAAAQLVSWSGIALPVLAAVAFIRMVLAIMAAHARRRNAEEDTTDTADRIARCITGRTGDPTADQTDSDTDDEITIRFETPIDETDLFRRPDRPRTAMDAVVRQLGEGSSIVAIKARRGGHPDGVEKA